MLNILDTAGTEFSCMWPQYIRNSDGFLLVFSLSNRCSLEEIFIRYEDILKVKDVSMVPMILVGNKSDLVDEREVSEDEARNLAGDLKIPYIEVSAKMDINVVECFAKIVRLIRLTTLWQIEKPKRKIRCQIA